MHVDVYQQGNTSQKNLQRLRVNLLVLAVQSRNCPLSKVIKQLFVQFLFLWFSRCSFFHKDSIKSFEDLKFVLNFELAFNCSIKFLQPK